MKTSIYRLDFNEVKQEFYLGPKDIIEANTNGWVTVSNSITELEFKILGAYLNKTSKTNRQTVESLLVSIFEVSGFVKNLVDYNIDIVDSAPQTIEKTMHNTDASKAKINVKDIVFWGNGDTFRLISKASSQKEGWMKSSKAMEIPGVGCVVQVTTQQGSNVAEAVTFVPGVVIEETTGEKGDVVSRKLVAVNK